MDRRSLLLGLGAVLAAPAIVRADSLMRVARLRSSVTGDLGSFASFDGDAYYMNERGFWRYSPRLRMHSQIVSRPMFAFPA